MQKHEKQISKATDETERGTVLLLGNYRPAVAIARALAPLGFSIVLGLQGEDHGVRFSRFVSGVWDHPPLDGTTSFHNALARHLGQHPEIKMVLPVTEEFVNAFAAQHHPLREGVTLVSPRRDIVNLFADKVHALETAKREGVATLPFAVVGDHAEMLSRADEIGYPITVRPLGTTARLFGKKALILASAEELRSELKSWPLGHTSLLLQRFARGIRHNVYFAARDGALIAVSQSKINRTNYHDGTGLAVDGQTTAPTPRLLEDTRRLAEAVNYTGIGLAQFIVDPQSGESCFLELNPRVSGSHAVPEQAGVPLSQLAVELAQRTEEHSETPIACQFGRRDMRYVWTSGDLYAAKMAIINRDAGLTDLPALGLRILSSLLRANMHMIWRWDDPLPGIVAVLGCLPRLTILRRALGRLPHGTHLQQSNR